VDEYKLPHETYVISKRNLSHQSLELALTAKPQQPRDKTWNNIQNNPTQSGSIEKC